jgi:hypothetical protein
LPVLVDGVSVVLSTTPLIFRTKTTEPLAISPGPSTVTRHGQCDGELPEPSAAY